MKFAYQFGIPGDVREPAALSVVPLEPVVSGEGGGQSVVPGYSGTALTLRTSPDGKAEPLGFVLACPQVPRWMSPEFPPALEDAHLGKINLDDYATEWFEKVVYLHKDDVAKAAAAPGGLAWTRAVTQLGPAFDNVESDGCARTTARTPLYRAQIGEDGLPTQLKYEGVYYSLVWDGKAGVREITLAPLDAREQFAACPQHKEELTESSRLGRLSDPQGLRAQARARHLKSVRDPASR